MLLIALIVLGASAFLFSTQLSVSPVTDRTPWLVYAAGFLLWLLGCFTITSANRAARRPPGCVVLLLILLLATFLRLYRFDSVPFGAWYDEVVSGLQARHILMDAGHCPIYILTMTLPHLLLYGMALELLGHTSPLSMRVVSVFFGVAAVIPAYFLGLELRSHRFGLFMAFIVAIMRWSLNFSRIAMTGIDVVFFTLCGAYFVLRLARYGYLRDALYAGFVIGAGLWFYRAFEIMLIPLAILALIAWRWDRPIVRTGILGVTTLLSLLVVTLPLILFVTFHSNEFFARVKTTSIFHQGYDTPTLVNNIVSSAQRHAFMFHVQGDRNGRHNLPEAPMLDPITGVLFGVGLVYGLTRMRRRENVFFILVLIAALTSAILSLSAEAPQGLRAIGAIASVTYFAALATELLYVLLERVAGGFATAGPLRGLPIGALAVGLLGASALAMNFHVFFDLQAKDARVWRAFSTPDTLVALELARSNPGTRMYTSQLLTNPQFNSFFAPDGTQRIAGLDVPLGLPLSISPQHVVILLDPSESWYLDRATQLYPNLWVDEVTPRDFGMEYGDVDDPVFYRLELTGADVAAVQGLQDGKGVLFVPEYGDYTFGLKRGQRLSVDGHTYSDPSVTLRLAKGCHTIELAPAGTGLTWIMPESDVFEPIPLWHFFHSPVRQKGLYAYYFSGDDWSGEPVNVQLEPRVYRYVHILPMSRPYSVIWKGELFIPSAGDYIFGLEASDSASLAINGEPVLSTAAMNRLATTTIGLAAGWQPVELRHLAIHHRTSIYFQWQRPGMGALVPVSDEYMRPIPFGK